jgi:ADP-heptose:LPS heptosyltransferase
MPAEGGGRRHSDAPVGSEAGFGPRQHWDPALSTANRTPAEWARARRLLVVRLDNIGDVIMAGPVLRSLRRAFPDAQITFMATPGGSQAVPLLPWVDDVIVRPVLWQDISGTWPFDPVGELGLIDDLRRRDFDAAIILTSFTQAPYPPAYVAYLAGIPLRIAQSREFGGGVLSQWVKPLPDDTHQVDRNLHLLEAAGIPIAGRRLELHIPAEIQLAADRLLERSGIVSGQPFVAIAPGASAEARRYDAQRFRTVAHTLSRAVHPVTGQSLRVVLLGSPRETALIEPLAASDSGALSDERRAGGGGVISLAGQTSVPVMAAVINRAALLIANNSGPLHMADALGRPMVVLYSGTEYESQWRPRSAPARLLRRSTFCTPCFAFRCRFNMECLDIAPETVVNEALAMLSGVARHAAQEQSGKEDGGSAMWREPEPGQEELSNGGFGASLHRPEEPVPFSALPVAGGTNVVSEKT